MKPIDIVLAVAVAVIWGVGFVATRFAVDEMSATLLTALRFAITALPCLFLPRPKLSLGLIIAISWLLVAQFLAQTYGLAHGVPAGLTAVMCSVRSASSALTAGFWTDAAFWQPTSTRTPSLPPRCT